MAYGLCTEDDDGESLTKKYISKGQETALRNAIKNNNISNEKVLEVLDDYGYTKLNEIEMEFYQTIVKQLGVN